MAATFEAEAHRRGSPHPVDLGGDELRRGLGLDHGRQPAQHRGRAAGRDPRAAQGAPAQQGAVADAGRRGVPEAVPRGGRGQARRARSCSWSRARSPTRRSTATATGPRWATTRPPASRSRSTTGSTGSRPRRLAVVAIGTCATYGGIHAMAGNPTGCDGPGRLPRLGLPLGGRPADRERARLPGAAGQLHGDAHLAALPGGRAGAR